MYVCSVKRGIRVNCFSKLGQVSGCTRTVLFLERYFEWDKYTPQFMPSVVVLCQRCSSTLCPGVMAARRELRDLYIPIDVMYRTVQYMKSRIETVVYVFMSLEAEAEPFPIYRRINSEKRHISSPFTDRYRSPPNPKHTISETVCAQ